MMRRFGVQHFSGGWIVGRKQRQRCEVTEKERQPHPAYGDGNDDVGDGDIERLRKIGLDGPEQIDIAHHEKPCRQPRQLANIAFEGTRQQSSERNREVEQYDDEADLAPSAIQPRQVKRDLVGQVSRPDDEPLGKVEVGPDHGEGEDPLAMIVDVIGLQHVGHGLVVEEDALDDDREAHCRENFTNQDRQAEDGGDPTGIERHDPVDDGEGDGEAVENEAGPGNSFELRSVVRSVRVIALLRP